MTTTEKNKIYEQINSLLIVGTLSEQQKLELENLRDVADQWSDVDERIIESIGKKLANTTNSEKLYNIIATHVTTGEQHIEKYDFNAADAQTWINNNQKNMPSYTFTVELVKEA